MQPPLDFSTMVPLVCSSAIKQERTVNGSEEDYGSGDGDNGDGSGDGPNDG